MDGASSDNDICGNSFNTYVITISYVIKGIGHLKHGKNDDTEGLYFDYLINGCDSLDVYLTMILVLNLCFWEQWFQFPKISGSHYAILIIQSNHFE